MPTGGVQDYIEINKYVYYSKEDCKFFLTNEAGNIIYREKNVISSYSGANEWCNHFICELMDVYNGVSLYNHAIGCFSYEKLFQDAVEGTDDIDSESAFDYIKNYAESKVGSKVFSLFEHVIDDLEIVE